MIDLTPTLDLFPLAAGVLAAVCCGVLGNFLVLRRLSLMGDAISHAVLPGLVIAFLLTSAREPLAMFLGAAAAGVGAVVLIELVRKLGRVEPGAAMGVVFSILFALGVLLIERAAVRHVDLDADCVLHGQLETLWWPGAPSTWAGVLSVDTVHALPPQIVTLLIACAIALLFTGVLFKELRIAAFDPGLASALGFNASALHYALMVLVAGATVAAFEAVGSILVIAMLICPAATARLLTDRLRTQILASIVIAAATAVLGYIGATAIPATFGKDSVNAAGSMACTAGVLLAIAAVASPSHGVVARAIRRRRLASVIAQQNLLAAVYRAGVEGEADAPRSAVEASASAGPARGALARAERADLVRTEGDRLVLTPAGLDAARSIVRKHRTWEHYLVSEAGVAPDHVHETAEHLEHLPIDPLADPANADAATDPHGKPIPLDPPSRQ
jgi:manganese/zinc/iron transport system permease protein